MKADFSGYATKNGLKCSDGRVIQHNAFKENDGQKVPLVWQHQHNNPDNILGHAKLENRNDGVYCYGFLNESESAKIARELLQHGDVAALSIYANNLVQRGEAVHHGSIKEVSLVLSGANPGAFIDNVTIQHDDSLEVLEDEAVIYGGTLAHAEDGAPEEDDDTDTDSDDGKTVQDVIDSMNDEQRDAMFYMIAAAAEGELADPDAAEGEDDDEAEHDDLQDGDSLTHQEDDSMTRNVFEQNGSAQTDNRPVLSHAQVQEIFQDADRVGSLKESVMFHAQDYGIQNIDLLFPDAKTLRNEPDLVKRRTEWVTSVINGTHSSPFSRIKSISADITHEEARAKGYINGNMKKEEYFGLAKRVTTPTTIYKKQKLDRDDIIDITDLDVVAWLKAEMRIMLDEEIARAVLVGDGREIDDPDKIPETNIRPIAKDDDFYTHKVELPADAYGTVLIEHILRTRRNYKGQGNPTMFTTEDVLTDLLLIKDKIGRRLYETEESLKSALRVSNIVVVDILEDTPDLLAIMVNLSDYTVGTDKGGQVSMFDDFDIDFNQYKYLMEGRMSGTLTKPKSAIAYWRRSGTEVIASQPSFDSKTNTITIPSVKGVEYLVNGEPKTGKVAIDEDVTVEAQAKKDHYLKSNLVRSWNFTFTAPTTEG